jgi:methionine synthase I (cobalamin-dependent)
MRFHDGAYGTLLAPHVRGGETADDLCLRLPTVVVDAHRAYLEAGATAIQTNAFLAYQRGSDRRRRELHRAAIDCARDALAAHGADGGMLVATIGPAGTQPRSFWRDLETVLDAGVDAVQCETVHERAIADAFLTAWHDVAPGVSDVELRLGCTVSPSRGSDAVRWVADLASEAPALVHLGLNCCEGPIGLRDILATISELRPGTWVMPSIGLPGAEVDDWATHVAELVAGLPIAAVGGCCGTTPALIHALVGEMDTV